MKQLLDSKFRHPRHIHSEADALGRRGILYMGPSAKGRAAHVDVFRDSETGDVRTSGLWHEGRDVLLYELE